MSVVTTLDKTSGWFFFFGFILSKMQYIPVPLVSFIFKICSLTSWTIAYSLWLFANIFRPNQDKNNKEWYGFAQIKEQFLFSSILGLSATLISIAAVFVPPLFPLAAWLFLFGNTLWSIGEYHKLNNPPHDPNFSYSRQKEYCLYALSSTLLCGITAISATLIFIFPPIAVGVTVFSLILTVGISFFSSKYWLNSTFGNHKPTPVVNSYNQMHDALGVANSIVLSDCPQPVFSNPLFNNEKPHNSIERDNSPKNDIDYGLSPSPAL